MTTKATVPAPPSVRMGRPPEIAPEVVRQVRALARAGWGFRAIGRHLRMDHSHVARIVRGEARRDVA